MIHVLPACPARQFVPGASVCKHEANTGRRVSFHECETCPLIGLVARQEAEPTSAEPTFSERCRHLGEQLRQAKCEPCGGPKTTPIFVCELHVECQPSKRAAGIRSCLACDDHQPNE